jgi:hypothetical protein
VFPITPLTAENALALALARGVLSAPGLPQAEALRAALDKVTGSLSPVLAELMRDAARVLRLGRPARDYSRAPLQELVSAAGARRRWTTRAAAAKTVPGGGWTLRHKPSIPQKLMTHKTIVKKALGPQRTWIASASLVRLPFPTRAVQATAFGVGYSCSRGFTHLPSRRQVIECMGEPK